MDILVHSIAFANPETFSQRVHEVSKDHFAEALVASSYSLLPLVRHCRPHFAPDASVMTLSYLGGQRVVSNYKLMGVAKAALSKHPCENSPATSVKMAFASMPSRLVQSEHSPPLRSLASTICCTSMNPSRRCDARLHKRTLQIWRSSSAQISQGM